MNVTGLFLYPVKSARAIALDTADIAAFGIAGDRAAMLIDADGMFVTQRELPDLARLSAIATPQGLALSLDDGRSVTVVAADGLRRLDVVVWRSSVNAALADDQVNAAISDWFGRPLRLALFDGAAQRMASAQWAGEGSPIRFSDGYQILVTNTASLAALNADMAAHGEGAVGMERFRPNIVVDHDEAFAEDRWAAISIGGIRFDLVKPCARCIITTQDQVSGSREGANPMPAMGRIRMSADRSVPGPLFGWNAVPRGSGKIALGDAVEVVEIRSEGWPIKRR